MTAPRLLAATAIALSLAFAGATAHAETKKELVAKVLKLQQPSIEGMGNLLASNTANQFMQAAGRALARVPADKREAVAKDIQAEVRKFYEDVAPQLRSAAVKLAPATLGATFEEKFSEDELKTLITWLESPVNKKLQQVTGEMQKSLGEKLMADSRPSIEPKLKALDQAVAGKLQAAGATPASGPAKK